MALISPLDPSAIQSGGDCLLMGSKHCADWLTGVMLLKAHLRPFWTPLPITSPRNTAQPGWLICHAPEPFRENRSEPPSPQPQPLEGWWRHQGHTDLNFCFPPTARSWLTHILAIQVSIYERHGSLNGSHSVDTSCLHFPTFPTPCLWLGFFF